MSKQTNQNLIGCLSYPAVRRTAYLNYCNGRMLKSLGLPWSYGFKPWSEW